MQCLLQREDKSLIESVRCLENVETSYFDNCTFFAVLAFFCYSFVSSILDLLLSHYVQLTSHYSLVCSLFYHVVAVVSTSLRLLRADWHLCCSCLEVIAPFCAVTM